MNRTPVSSSSITSVGYNPKTAILEIEFTSGRVYQYFNVPGSTYQDFINSGSLGSAFNSQIKDYYTDLRVH